MIIVRILSNPLVTYFRGFRRKHFKSNAEGVIKHVNVSHSNRQDYISCTGMAILVQSVYFSYRLNT